MSEKKAAPVQAEHSKYELVTVMVPLGRAGEEQQIFLSVNGRTWLVPRGKQVELPAYAADVLKKTLRQELKYERDVAGTYR